MITTREGREIIAEALRAVATVLDNRNQRDRSLQSGDPVTSPAAEMIAGTIGVAQTAADLATDAATGVMVGGISASDAETRGSKGSRVAGMRRRKRTTSGNE
jgi:hypothetical protein